MSAKQSESIGIKLENCSGGTVRGNVSVGHDVGIDAKDSHGIEYVDNVSVAPEVAAVFLGLIAAIEGSSLDPSAKQKLVQCAHAMWILRRPPASSRSTRTSWPFSLITCKSWVLSWRHFSRHCPRFCKAA